MMNLKRFGAIGSVGLGLVLAACGSGDKGDKGDTGGAGAAGTNGTNGANGKDGTGTPTFQIVEPRAGLIAREVDVTLSAQGATFDAANPPTVDFADAKIAVSNVKVVSATTIYAHLKIDATATIGAHDVTVGALKGTGAFEVKPDITLTVSAGKAEQGGLAQFDIHSNDLENAFDTGSSPDPNNPFGSLPNFALAAPGTALFNMNSTTADSAQAILLLEPGITAGPLSVQVANAPNGVPMQTYLADPAAVTVAARAPTALTLGTAKAGEKLAGALSTNLYSAASTGTGILTWTIKPASGGKLLADVLVFPASGKLADLVAFGQAGSSGDTVTRSLAVATGTLDARVLVFDGTGSGGTGFDYDVTASMTAVASVTAEAATAANAHNATGTAQALTFPALVTGTIAADGEIDAYKVTIPASTTVEFTLSGAAKAFGAFPADQTGLVIAPPDPLFGGGDVAVASGPKVLTDTQKFVQPASPTTTTMYFVVAGNTNQTGQAGAYTASLRVLAPVP